jgi:hypothetical protein
MFNHNREGEVMSDITTVGIDLAKNTFSVCGIDKAGTVVFRRAVSRNKLSVLVAQLTHRAVMAK